VDVSTAARLAATAAPKVIGLGWGKLGLPHPRDHRLATGTPTVADLGSGAEISQHVQLRIDTGIAVYFCDPHSPWQCGTDENTNGLLRHYFPKGTEVETAA